MFPSEPTVTNAPMLRLYHQNPSRSRTSSAPVPVTHTLFPMKSKLDQSSPAKPASQSESRSPVFHSCRSSVKFFSLQTRFCSCSKCSNLTSAQSEWTRESFGSYETVIGDRLSERGVAILMHSGAAGLSKLSWICLKRIKGNHHEQNRSEGPVTGSQQVLVTHEDF